MKNEGDNREGGSPEPGSGRPSRRITGRLSLLLAGILVTAFLVTWGTGAFGVNESEPDDPSSTPTEGPVQELADHGLSTDTSKRSVELDELVSGGPPKDGIPALSPGDLAFGPPAMADLRDSVRGILVEFEGERRFYPFSILVWHEIANDHIGDTHFAVTFCPLCGSGIVFDREVDGRILTFGVSGLLYESNLVMFDRGTESLWSQSLGQAIAGFYTGTELEILPMQLLPFQEAREKYPDMRVLSKKTGYNKDYDRNPYSGYETSDSVYFPVSVQDSRFFAKELMYVFRLEGEEAADGGPPND